MKLVPAGTGTDPSPQLVGDRPSTLIATGQIQIVDTTTEARPLPAVRTTLPVGEGVTRGRKPWVRLARLPWPLLAVLIVQAGLSLRLVWTNTAFGDEALYLWAGHLELSHWLHGTPVSQFQTWFSGAPIIYPPLGAVADSIGGLAGARVLSLLFMLGATLCLYGITARLFGRREAYYAIATYVVLGPTQALGAFATFDAMSLFLLAFATWLGVRSCSASHAATRIALLVAAGSIIALADVTKYAAGIFNPIVVLLIVFAIWQKRSYRVAVNATAIVVAVWLMLIAGAIYLGGKSYWQGVLFTTVARATSTSSAGLVLHESFNLVGPVFILAVFGVIASLGSNLMNRLICSTALVAVLLAPLNQARIHTTVSLHKHVDFGALFGCIAVGYLLARVSRVDRRRYWHVAIGIAAIGPVLLFGLGQAVNLFTYWPNASGYISVLRPLMAGPKAASAHYSIEEPWDVYYYLHDEVHPNELLNDYWDNSTHRELDGLAAVEKEIPLHYLSVIEIDETGNRAQDAVVERLLAASGAYQLIYHHPWSYEGETHQIEVWRLKAGAQ
jgi:4-amino-4-deoxy-L-arabinose transferase-like glycosyltransferase